MRLHDARFGCVRVRAFVFMCLSVCVNVDLFPMMM